MKTLAAFAFVAFALAACSNNGAKPDPTAAASASAPMTGAAKTPAAPSAAPKAGSGW